MAKHYIVTGASRGIGYETAIYLAGTGCTVTAIARSGSKLEQLRQQGGECIKTLELDLTDDDSAGQIVKYLDSGQQKVDGLVNNAGILINKPFDETNERDWGSHIQLNLMAPVRIIRKLLPYFNSGSHILNISSMGGFQGSSKFPGLTAYSVSKGALAILTECLSEELKDQQINCNCLCLGAVQTEMLEEAFPGFSAPVSSKEMGVYIGKFLAEGHRFYNGKILPVSMNNPS